MRPAGALTCAAVAEELKGKLGIEPTARAEDEPRIVLFDLAVAKEPAMRQKSATLSSGSAG